MKRYAIVLSLVCALLLFVAAPALAYDRDSAVTHAEAAWDSASNSTFPGYSSDSDCANFASGCLYFGGVVRDPQSDSSGWWCYKAGGKQIVWNRSNAWVNADQQRQFFLAQSGVSEVGSGYNFYGLYVPGYPANDIAMMRGDGVSINWDRDVDVVSDHTEFGVGIGTSLVNGSYYGDLIDQHSNPRHKAIWNCLDRKSMISLEYAVFRVWHLSDSFVN